MAVQPRKSRTWIWVLVALGVIIIGGICAFSALVAALFSGAAGGGASFGDAIALIRIEGTIGEGEDSGNLFGGGGASSTVLIDQLKRASNDSSVKAIVLRVNSPGGGIVASDDIYRAVLRARDAGKKVVISMGTVAASGGYYISVAADRIVASPGTLTGSIGVISTVPNAEELMNKIGVSMTVIKSGPYKDEGSPYRPMTDEEIAYFQEMIDQTYGQFVDVVARGRNMDVDTVRSIGNGRVYTGQRALELGLVDELGDLQYTIDVAARMGGIRGKPRIIEYRRPSFFESAFGATMRSLEHLSPTSMFANDGRATIQYLYIQ